MVVDVRRKQTCRFGHKRLSARIESALTTQSDNVIDVQSLFFGLVSSRGTVVNGIDKSVDRVRETVLQFDRNIFLIRRRILGGTVCKIINGVIACVDVVVDAHIDLAGIERRSGCIFRIDDGCND